MSNQVITDEQIAGLAPSLFAPAECPPDMDEEVRAQFYRIYKPLRDEHMHEYNLLRIATGLYYYRPLLERLLQPTRTKNAVEIGSGMGLKSLCWADLFRSPTRASSRGTRRRFSANPSGTGSGQSIC